MTSPYKEHRGCSTSFDFFSFQTKPVLLHELKPSPFSGDSELLAFVSVFQSSQEIGAPFLASQGKLFFLRLCLPHTHVGASPCGASFSACLFSLLGLFLERFPLSQGTLTTEYQRLISVSTNNKQSHSSAGP